MTGETFDDITLMAYADGEADPETAARVGRALATDAALAARLANFVDSRYFVKAAMEDQLEPVPDALAVSIRQMADAAKPDNVVSLAARRRPSFVPTAIAAGIALAVGLAGGWLVRLDTATSSLHIVALNDPDVVDAFATLPSGEARMLDDGSSVTAIASFRDGSGALCREMEHDRTDSQTLVAVACRSDGEWSVRLAVAAGAEGGYAPASSLETLDAWLVATGAGQPLSTEDEAIALRGAE